MPNIRRFKTDPTNPERPLQVTLDITPSWFNASDWFGKIRRVVDAMEQSKAEVRGLITEVRWALVTVSAVVVVPEDWDGARLEDERLKFLCDLDPAPPTPEEACGVTIVDTKKEGT